MNKAELVEAIVQSNDVTKAAAGRIVDDVFENISNTLKSGGDVRFVGFGSFSVKNRPARTSRNPQTGAEIKVPASKRVVFRPGKELKDSINA